LTRDDLEELAAAVSRTQPVPAPPAR
jgi:hypothetical protein